MHPSRFFIPLLLLFCCFATSAAALDKSGWPSHLRLLTGPKGGQWHTMGDPIVRELGKEVLPSTSRAGGGLDNIKNLNQKSGEIGFSLACFMGAAGSGEAEYQDIHLENVSIMAKVYPQVLYFLVRKDFAEEHNISSVASLLSKRLPVRFASLKPGTASEFIISLLLKYGYNTSFDNLKEQGWNIAFNNYAETADAFVTGHLDCFAYTAGTDVPLIKIMEEHTGVTVLPLEREVLDLLTEKFKTDVYTIAPGAYKSISSPVITLSDWTCLMTRKDLPDSLVYEICKALWQGREAVTKVIEDFGQLAPETAIPAGLPVHPGAVKFWTEEKER
ncbi:TAXI family TRAP transporter solute-binding subunit [Desulfovibrio sp. OttesenSCG-928-G11]|nr:TAXI family TRAP transporter solute-binding subunit [Desulfovibrio sp. OttesenSCG-928-G11]